MKPSSSRKVLSVHALANRDSAELRAHADICRDSSVGRASDRRSEGPRFDPGSRHLAGRIALQERECVSVC